MADTSKLTDAEARVFTGASRDPYAIAHALGWLETAKPDTALEKLIGAAMSLCRTVQMLGATPELLELARRYAGECAECSGTGVRHGTIGGDGYGDRCAAIADVEYDCEDCADIRAVIAKAVSP